MKEKIKQFKKEIIGGLVLFVGIVAIVLVIVLGQNQEKETKTKVTAAQSTEKESVSTKGGKKEEKEDGTEGKEKKTEAVNKKEADKEEKKDSKKEESKSKEEVKKKDKTAVAANGVVEEDKREEKAHTAKKEEAQEVKEEKRTSSPAKEEVKHSHTWVTNYKTVTVPAVTRTVHHDAVYENRYVVDSPARTEEITEGHYFSVLTGEDLGTDIEYVGDWCIVHNSSYTVRSVVIGTREIPEQGHYESVLVQDAYDEEIIVSPETTKEVADGQICSGCGARR